MLNTGLMRKLRKGSSWRGDGREDVKQDEVWFLLGLKEVQIEGKS